MNQLFGLQHRNRVGFAVHSDRFTQQLMRISVLMRSQ